VVSATGAGSPVRGRFLAGSFCTDEGPLEGPVVSSGS
jgi:hypothetical protein